MTIDKQNTKSRIKFIIGISFPVALILCVVIFCIYACPGIHYYFRDFSYPPGSLAAAYNWDFHGRFMVYVMDKDIDPADEGKKNIRVFVWNKFKDKLLVDDIEVECGFIEPDVTWETFEDLRLDIYEYPPFKDHKVKNFFMTLHYTYDEKTQKFIKQDTLTPTS